MEQTEQNVDIRSIKIEDLELSMRTYNVLKLARINTLGDILDKTYDYLSKVRNMGLHSLKELEEKLNEYGYGFSGDGTIVLIPVASVGTSYKVSDRALLVDIIDDRRLTNPLERAGIKTVGEFRSKTEKELLKIRTFGVVKLRLVKEAIANAVPKDNETTEESVIDIAEQAAKEVEEERKGPDTRILNELTVKLGKAEDIIADLQKTLNEKNQRIAHLEDAIDGSQKRIDNILGENTKLINTLNSYRSNDVLRAVGRSIDLMKEQGITKLDTCIGGYSVEIIQKYLIASKEAGHGRV